jgi:hypothetical protein
VLAPLLPVWIVYHTGSSPVERLGVRDYSAMGLVTGLPAWGALLLLAGAVALHTYGELSPWS